MSWYIKPQIPACKSLFTAHRTASSSPPPPVAEDVDVFAHSELWQRETLEGREGYAGAATRETFERVVQHNPSPRRIFHPRTKGNQIALIRSSAQIRSFGRLVFGSASPRVFFPIGYPLLFYAQEQPSKLLEIFFRTALFIFCLRPCYILTDHLISGLPAAFKPLTVSYQI